MYFSDQTMPPMLIDFFLLREDDLRDVSFVFFVSKKHSHYIKSPDSYSL